MTTLTPEFIQQAMDLPADERERLACLLFDSLDDAVEPDAELQGEVQRRWDRYQSGVDPTYTLEETMAALRKQAADRMP